MSSGTNIENTHSAVESDPGIGLTDIEAPAPVQDPTGSTGLHLEEVVSSARNSRTIERGENVALGTAASSRVSFSTEYKELISVGGWLTFFSILGTLSRLGLAALTTYDGSPIQGVIWANFTGCVFMGFFVENRKQFSAQPPLSEKSSVASEKLPLYIGLTTGYCGSFTSFSSFELDAFKNLINVLPVHDGRPTGGYNVLAYFAYVICTLALSFVGLQFGAHLTIFLHRLSPAIPVRAHNILNIGVLPISACMWVGAILMAVYIPNWRGDALFACCFAPLGVFVRFWVSRWANPTFESFPMGTFFVNMAGTAILAAMTVVRLTHIQALDCQLTRGIGDGFCGCLTTVSTFVVEAKSSRLKHAYFYTTSSIITGLILMVLILGSPIWTRKDLREALC